MKMHWEWLAASIVKSSFSLYFKYSSYEDVCTLFIVRAHAVVSNHLISYLLDPHCSIWLDLVWIVETAKRRRVNNITVQTLKSVCDINVDFKEIARKGAAVIWNSKKFFALEDGSAFLYNDCIRILIFFTLLLARIQPVITTTTT